MDYGESKRQPHVGLAIASFYALQWTMVRARVSGERGFVALVPSFAMDYGVSKS
jgi:hypothetical protein